MSGPDVAPFDLVAIGEIQDAHRILLERRSRQLVQPTPFGDDTVLCRVLGRYKFLVDNTDLGFAPHVALDGFWEIWITQYLAGLVKPGMAVADVGANHGYYSVIFADLIGENGSLVAVEPNPHMARLLRINVAINGYANRTRIVEAALSNETGVTTFAVPNGEPKNGYVVGPDAAAVGDTYEVATISGADLFGDARLDLLKIDAEGSEFAILEGLMHIIERQKPTIVVECNAHRSSESWGLLTRLKNIYGACSELLTSGQTVQVEPNALLTEKSSQDRMLVFARPTL